MSLQLMCLATGIVVLLFVSLLIDLRQYVNSGFDAHPHHFFYPALFFVVAYIVRKSGDTPLDWGFIGLGIVMAGWMIAVSLREKWTASREADTDFLKTYHRLSPEERSELGYMPSKDSLRIETVRHNPKTGAYEGESHNFIPSSPAKFRLWCQGIIEGAPLTFAKWGGKGKLYSDPEYELLLAKLLELNYIKFKNGKTSDNGFLPTEEGILFFQEFIGQQQLNQEAEEILHNSLHAPEETASQLVE